MQEAGEDGNQKDSSQKRTLDYPLLLSHPTQGMAMQDHEEASTLKLRSPVAGELAMRPHPPYLGWGKSPVMAQAPGPGEPWSPVLPATLPTKHTGEE